MKNLYAEHKGIIYNRVKYFKEKTKAVPYDDLICVANLAFVEAYQTWNKTESKFSTFLYNTLNIKLFNYIKKEKKRFYREINADDFILEQKYTQPLDIFDISKIPSKGAEIVKIILDKKNNIENSKNKITKSSLTKHLKDIGWKKSEIENGFISIQKHIHQEFSAQ